MIDVETVGTVLKIKKSVDMINVTDLGEVPAESATDPKAFYWAEYVRMHPDSIGFVDEECDHSGEDNKDSDTGVPNILRKCIAGFLKAKLWELRIQPGKPRLALLNQPVDKHAISMHGLCMPTKTISIELDAYEKLAAAKTGPRDSFSKVIRRTRFEKPTPTGSDLLDQLDKLFADLPEDNLSLEEALDTLPDDPPVSQSPWDEMEKNIQRKRNDPR